jgi:peroxiredoxin
MARQKTKAAFPFVMDLGAEHTAGYSVDGFSTYVIDQAGTVKAELTGTKMARPAAEEVLKKVKEVVRAVP